MRAVPAPARSLVAARRVAATLAAVALVVAACGDDGTTAEPATSSTGTLATLPGGQPVTTATGEQTTVTTAAGSAVPAPTTTAVPPTITPAEPGGPPPATLDANVPVGHFAAALLRPDLSERLVVEVHVEDRSALRQGTVDHVAEVLGQVSGKPVEVVTGGDPEGGARDWTADELRQVADAGATVAQGNGVAVVRLLFVAGSFEGDDSVLGVAVRGDVAAVFYQRVDRAAGLVGGAGIEEAVAVHELGHLLGLVDIVLDTGRDDPEHPGHSRNEGSVMYWAIESDLVGPLLGSNPPNDFDADDRRDLAAIGDG